MNRLPHVVACASKFNPDPNWPVVVQYWWDGGLGQFFPFPHTEDAAPPSWNVTECYWIVPGTIGPDD